MGTREQCLAAAAKWTPVDCEVNYRKSLSGVAWPTLNKMSVPHPVTRKALYIYLHECAHLHLMHTSKVARHVEEMQAEQWAHQKMREAGIPVPREMTRRAKEYVGRKIDQALQHGAKHIDSRARKYAGLPRRDLYTVEVEDFRLTETQSRLLDGLPCWIVQRFEQRPSGKRFWRIVASSESEWRGREVQVDAPVLKSAVAAAQQKLGITS